MKTIKEVIETHKYKNKIAQNFIDATPTSPGQTVDAEANYIF